MHDAVLRLPDAEGRRRAPGEDRGVLPDIGQEIAQVRASFLAYSMSSLEKRLRLEMALHCLATNETLLHFRQHKECTMYIHASCRTVAPAARPG